MLPQAQRKGKAAVVIPVGNWQCPFLIAAISLTLLSCCCKLGAPSTAKQSVMNLGLVQALFISNSPDRPKHLANTNNQVYHLAAARGASSFNILLRLLQITTFVVFKT